MQIIVQDVCHNNNRCILTIIDQDILDGELKEVYLKYEKKI